MYFGKIILGTAAYWNSKKAEFYSWINSHVEQGRGAYNVWPKNEGIIVSYLVPCVCSATRVDTSILLANMCALFPLLTTSLK
jgi:hypothetical protein